MTFTRVLVMVAITAAAVYLGLNLLLPKHAKEAAAEGTTSDQVFGTTAAPAGAPGATSSDAPSTTPVPAPPEQAQASQPTAETASSPAPDAAAPAPAATETAAAAPSPAPSSDSALEAMNKTPPASSDTLTPDEARKIADAVRKGGGSVAESMPAPSPVAAAPASPSPAPASSAGSDSLSAEEARKIAENVSREVATRVAENTAPAPAVAESSMPSSSGGSLSEADVRRIATEVARQVVAEKHAGRATSSSSSSSLETAAPKPAKAKKSRAAAGEVASAPAATAKSSGGSSKSRSKALPADALRAWWPTGSQPADKLNLLFAGQASTGKSVVLSFGSDVSPASASGHIQLLDARGVAPKGAWAAGNNGHVLVYKVAKAGRYTVILKPDLTDAAGKMLGQPLHGPVYIQ